MNETQPQREKREGTMTAERWQRMIRVIDQTFTDYERGLVSLREKVVANLKRKLGSARRLTD